MKINLICFLTACTIATAHAQENPGEYIDAIYTYELPNSFDASSYTTDVYGEDSSYVALDRNIVAYELIAGQIKRKVVSHKVHYIANENDIEKVNRLYIYNGGAHSVENVEVRTIKSNGDIVNLDDSKMEDISREEGSSNYQILAVSGIEADSWVEIAITKYQPPHLRFDIDNPFPTANAEVYVHCASTLANMIGDRKVRTKHYGDFTSSGKVDDDEITFSKLKDNQDEPTYSAKNIDPYLDESYSHEHANVSYVDVVDLYYNWIDVGDGIGSNIFPLPAKFETNGRFWLRSLDVLEADPITQIRVIEKFIKQEITETDANDDQYEDTRKIWKKRIANSTGILRMADQLFNAANLEYYVYLCADKNYISIDRDFPFTIGLSDIIFHFPEQNLYVVPDDEYRYAGALPDYLASVEALRIKHRNRMVDVDRVQRLPDADKAFNMDGTRAIIFIDELEETCTVKKTKVFYGDRASVSRGYYHFSDEDDRKKYIEELLVDDTEMELSDVLIKNESFDLNFQYQDTLFYSGVLKGNEILSSIPNGFILNPGGIMGTQVSFYDSEQRISEVYIPESKVYEHRLIVEIPEGYTVEGAENLEFDEKYFTEKRWLYGETRSDVDALDATEPTAEFVSTVTQEDGKLIIDIHEFYVEGFYPKETVEELKEVVNAAYEFFIAKIKLVQQ